MALQGTIDSFPLVDVLQLLTTSNKTGRLDLVGDRGRGALWVADGLLVSGAIQGQEATEAADAVWELLRFADGSFEFRAGEKPREPTFSAPVEETVERATEMLAEWDQVMEKVPGLGHRVSLADELPGEDVRLRGDDWSVVVAAGPGPKVGELLDRLELAEFGGCRRLSEMVDRGLIVVTPDTIRAEGTSQGYPADEASVQESPVQESPVQESAEHAVESTDLAGRSDELPAESGTRSEPGAVDPAPDHVSEPVTTPGSVEETGFGAGAGSADGAPAREEVALDDRPVSELYGEPGPTEPPVVPAAQAEVFPQADAFPQPEVASGVETTAAVETAAVETAAHIEPVPSPVLDVAVDHTEAEFPDHFPIDDLVDADESVGWDTSGGIGSPATDAQPEAVMSPESVPAPEAAITPESSPADPFSNGNQPSPAAGAVPAGPEASDDVLAQIGRLSPKAAEAIAAALGDNHESPQ